MTASEASSRKTHYYSNKGSSSSASKTIAASVTASLIVAILTNAMIFIATFSKMTVIMENIERRVAVLETETRNALDSKYQLEIKLAKQERTLEQILVEVKDVKESLKVTNGFKPNGR